MSILSFAEIRLQNSRYVRRFIDFSARKFKADYPGGKQRQILMVTEGVSPRRKVSKVFKKNPVEKIRLQLQQYEKC